MASISIPSENRQIDNVDEIRQFLEPYGIWFENWQVEGRIDKEANSEEILSAYKKEIDKLKERGGYVTADVIQVSPETPGLEAMLAKFSKEHTHSEDEVRFIISGGGIFYINGKSETAGDKVFAIQVEEGDLINVPKRTRHWFDLCQDRRVKAIRLFIDPAGWTPDYVDDNIDDNYEPLCWGPRYI